MKKIIFAGVILFSVFAFSSVGQATFTTEGTSETFANQGILPMSNETAVLGIDMTRTGAETLAGVTVTFTNIQGFTQSDLANIPVGATIKNVSGVTLYKDHDTLGTNGVFDEYDSYIQCDTDGGWPTVILDNFVEVIPDNDTGANKGDDWFVVIKTSDTIKGEGDTNNRDKFTVKLSAPPPDDGIDVITDTITAEAGVVDMMPHRSDWSSVDAGATNTNKLYPGTSSDSDIYRFYFSSPDEGYEPGVWHGSNDEKPQLLAINTETAVLGLDVAAPKGTQDNDGYVSESLTSVEVTLTDINNIDFNPNQILNWIALYEDTDANGIFSSAADTRISDKETAWTIVSPYTITLSPFSADKDIEQTVDYKVDYFIVVNSKDTDLGYGVAFKFSIEHGDVIFGTAVPDQGLKRAHGDCKPIYANLKLNYATLVAFPSGSTHSYIPTDYWANLAIDATSSVIPVIGIDICDGYDASDNDLDKTLDSVKVTFSGDGFDPKVDLASLSRDRNSGVSLWKDNKTTGWVGTFDEANDDPITLNQHPTWDGNSVILYMNGCELYPSDDYTNDAYRGDDYFICIRTSEDISYDDKITVTINDNDIQCGGWTSCNGSGIIVDTFTSNLPTILSDETITGQEISRDSDATAVLGINLVRPVANVYFSSLVVQFLNKGGDTDFTISDLDDLSKDAGTSGLALYKDNKGAGTRGVFDSHDTEVDLIAKPCQFGPGFEDYYRVQMVLATPQIIYDSDTAGNNTDKDDYFVVIRTSKHLEDGDDFSVRLHGSGVYFRSQALGFAENNSTAAGGTVNTVAGSKINVVGNPWVDNDYIGQLLVLTSGVAEGRCFYINDNETNSVTCNDADFGRLKVANADTFKFLPILRTTYEKKESNTLTGYLPVNVSSPSIEKDPARDNTYTITWTNKDLPVGSTVSIYYDTDNDDSTVTEIATGLSSAAGTQTYTWTFNAGSIPDGYYYIYIKAVEADGVTRITSDYSAGTVWTKDDNPPTKSEVSEPSSNVVFDGCTDTFVDGDGTDTAGPGDEATKETIAIGAGLTSFKTADLVYWYDADSSNTWSDGDALWLDNNYDGRYDSGDFIIIGSPVVNTTGTILSDDYHFVYYDSDKDAGYDSGEDIYYEAGEGNHYNWYSGSSSSYEVTIRYDARDSDSEDALTLYADDDTNPDNGFALTIANLTEEDGEGTYPWDVSGLSGVSYYVCAEVDDGFNYPLYGYSTGKAGVNNYPYIKVSSPSVDTWTYGSSYTISWTDTDPDDNALISLYYDEDTIADNGNETLITTTTEDSATDSYEWSISSVANGTYYIAGKIDDGANNPYYSCSEGKLTIMDTPEVILTAVESYDAVTLNWTDSTPDVDDKTIEIYRKDGKYVGTESEEWSEHTKIATPSSSDTSYEDTSLELGVLGGYWVIISSSSLGTFWLSNSDTSVVNPLEAQRLAFPDEETPDGLEVIPGVNVITVQWNDNSENEDSCEVERKLGSAGTDKYTNITTTSANSTSYDDTDVTADVGYSYQVRARKYYPETGNYGYSKYTGEAAETSYTFDDNLTVGEAGGGGGCFIATAAFGSLMAKEVILLKKFRDEVLMKTDAGKSLIELYYSASPPIANFIRNEPMLKAIVRMGLKPLVWWSREIMQPQVE